LPVVFFNWFFSIKRFFQYFYFFFLAVFLAAFFAFLATGITSFSEKRKMIASLSKNHQTGFTSGT
jgi:hypothetical protein